MDNFEKIEQLVNKTDCSYEDAKATLEGCGWDMIDAIIKLEKEGKVKKESACYTEKPAEEAKDIPEITLDVKGGNSGNQNSNSNAGNSEKAAKEKIGLWQRFKRMMSKNRLVIIKNNGQQLADLPIWIPIVALICFFWATLILAVIAMVVGCRFHFEGEDLGKIDINDTMDKATDYAEKVKNDLTKKKNDGQNTDN
jgi:hypothetical protein